MFRQIVSIVMNKTGTSQVGAALKAQKAQRFSNMLRTFLKISCLDEWVRLFSNLFLDFFRFSKRQNNSYITQKSTGDFFGDNLEIFERFFFEKCRIVLKNVKGRPFLIYKHAFCCKIKNSRAGPFGYIKKFCKKKSHSAKKNHRGDPLVSSGFVGYLEKVKNERGTLCTKFALAGLGLRWFQPCS